MKQTQFKTVREINGKNNPDNRLAHRHGRAGGKAMSAIGPTSDVGKTLAPLPSEEEEE